MTLTLLAAACVNAPKTVEEWHQAIWIPLRTSAPVPEAATNEACEASLVAIRDQVQADSVAPNAELQKAFEEWSEAAQSLTFECASDDDQFSYAEGYAELTRLAEQVDRIVEDSG